MNSTAVIYSRVSSLGERQSDERQIEDLKILAKQKNYTIEKNLRRENIRSKEKCRKTYSHRVLGIQHFK